MQSLSKLNELPYELRQLIFEKIDKKEILKCTRVCKQWRSEIEETKSYKVNFAKIKKEYHECYPAMVQARSLGRKVSLGITLLGVAALIPCKYVPKSLSGLLISGGVSGAVYAFGSGVERYTLRNFLKKTGIGALTFVISNVSQAMQTSCLLSKRQNLVTRAFNRICSSFVSYVASETVNNARLPSLKNTVIHLAGSVCNSLAAGLIDQRVKKTSKNLLEIFGRQFMIGSTLSGVDQATRAILTNKDWDNEMITNLVGQMIVAGTLKGLVGVRAEKRLQEILRRRTALLNKAPNHLKDLECAVSERIQQHYKQVLGRFGPQVDELLQSGWTPKEISNAEFVEATEFLAKKGSLEFVSPEGESRALSDLAFLDEWSTIEQQQEALLRAQDAYIATMGQIQYQCGPVVNYALGSSKLSFKEGPFLSKDDVFHYLYAGNVLHIYEPAPFPPIDTTVPTTHYDGSVQSSFAYRNLIQFYLQQGYAIKADCNGCVDSMLEFLHKEGKLDFYIVHTLTAAGCKPRYGSNLYDVLEPI